MRAAGASAWLISIRGIFASAWLISITDILASAWLISSRDILWACCVCAGSDCCVWALRAAGASARCVSSGGSLRIGRRSEIFFCFVYLVSSEASCDDRWLFFLGHFADWWAFFHRLGFVRSILRVSPGGGRVLRRASFLQGILWIGGQGAGAYADLGPIRGTLRICSGPSDGCFWRPKSVRGLDCTRSARFGFCWGVRFSIRGLKFSASILWLFCDVRATFLFLSGYYLLRCLRRVHFRSFGWLLVSVSVCIGWKGGGGVAVGGRERRRFFWRGGDTR